MPFLAKLTIDGQEEIPVLHCSYRFTQAADATGKPTSQPRGGHITLVVESTKSTGLFEWMVHPVSTKSGVITFFRRDMRSKLKTLGFSDACCIDYYEAFDHKSEDPMQMTLTISAKKIRLNNSEFINNQPEMEM